MVQIHKTKHHQNLFSISRDDTDFLFYGSEYSLNVGYIMKKQTKYVVHTANIGKTRYVYNIL